MWKNSSTGDKKRKCRFRFQVTQLHHQLRQYAEIVLFYWCRRSFTFHEYFSIHILFLSKMVWLAKMKSVGGRRRETRLVSSSAVRRTDGFLASSWKEQMRQKGALCVEPSTSSFFCRGKCFFLTFFFFFKEMSEWRKPFDVSSTQKQQKRSFILSVFQRLSAGDVGLAGRSLSKTFPNVSTENQYSA